MSGLHQGRSFKHGRWKLSPHNSKSKLLKPFFPFEVAKITPAKAEEFATFFGTTPEDEEKYSNRERASPHFRNGSCGNDYIVSVEEDVDETGGEMFWLSGRTNDNLPANDWRDLQEIKNMIIGPECEAVQLYPADDRVVDEANQFHLWVCRDPKYRFPFGYREGSKIYSCPPLPCRQRPFGLR